MAARHILSISDMNPQTLSHLINRALAMAGGQARETKPLAGKIVGIYFRRSSTRTRTAFTVGAIKLGAATIPYGPKDLQTSTGETIEDTSRVLSGFLDALVIRTNESMGEMRILASQDNMSIINAMSEDEHPTQAIADLVTIREEFGRLSGIHTLYIGEGNNTAAALALAISLTPGMQLTLVTPDGYGLPESVLDKARRLARQHDASVEQRHEIGKLPTGVDAVYTSRWQTMGEPKSDPNWRSNFEPYTVTTELMAKVSKPRGTIFLHDLPAARGCAGDVVDEVLDGPQSRAFRQARHKLSSAMAVLEWCLAGEKAFYSTTK